MKRILLIFIFFLTLILNSFNPIQAQTGCVFPPNTTVDCGGENYCKVGTCDLVNDIERCETDANSNKSNCFFLRTELHEANSPVCAAECKPSPPVCETITCFGVDNAGGTCSYPGSPNSNIPGCTATCPGTGKKVPGFTVSACQTNNCFYNDCTCYPNAGECVTPPPAPNLSCPVPPAVTNVRVECPYCL